MAGLRVLVVDDDPATLRLFSAMLEAGGHRPRTAEDVEAAARHLRAGSFDVLILDVHLPPPGSEHVMRAVHGSGARVQVLGLSDSPSVDALIFLMRFGAVDFLKKPVTQRDLDAALARATIRAQETSAPTAKRPRTGVSRRRAPPKRASGRPAAVEAPPTGRADASLVDRIAATLDSMAEGRLPLPSGRVDPTAVFSALEDDEGSLEDVVAAAGEDPLLAAEIVRVASVGRITTARPIKTLRDACLQLGNRAILGVAQEVLVGRMHRSGSPHADAVGEGLWRNTRAARALADRVPGVDEDSVHLAALLHNIGEALVLQALVAIARAGGPPVRDPAAIAKICGVLHERVGGRFLAAWKAPPAAARLAGAHHAAPKGRESTTSVALRRLVLGLWAAAVSAGYGYMDEHRGMAFEDLLPGVDASEQGELGAAVEQAALDLGLEPISGGA